MPKTPAVVDFGDDFAIDETPVPSVLVKGIFGEDFHVLQDVNLFAAMAMADDEPKLSDMHRMMISFIREDEQVKFKTLVSRQRNLDAEQIGKLFSRLLEVASSGHPQSSSSGSSRTTRAKAVGRGSAGALSAG